MRQCIVVRRPSKSAAVELLERRIVASATLTVRIATYNVEADINGVTTPRAGLYQVLEGIGEELVQGSARPLDVLALQETTSNAATVAPIVTALNNYYSGAATYAQSTYQATQVGSNTTGNGPNALVYNNKTLKLLTSVGVGTPTGSTNGEYRQVVRYAFQPVGATGTTGTFYLYDAHSKSGTGTTNATDRNDEARLIRNDEATLPADARVIYAGDFNTTASTDASYQTLIAAKSPSGVTQGAGFDPVNRPGAWDNNVAFADVLTESSTSLRYRDDHQLVTQNVLTAQAGGLAYVAGSYHTFGNNGTTPIGGSVNSGSNTAFSNRLVQDGGTFISATTLYADLTTASDHLPVVADYTVPTQAIVPAITAWQTNDGTSPASLTRAGTLTFNEPVTLAAGAFTLNRLQTDASGNIIASTDVTAGLAWSNPSADGKTWVLTPKPGGIIDSGHGWFADGVYRLTVHATAVHDASSNAMAADQTLAAFFTLTGDANGDGIVDFSDFVALSNHFGTSVGANGWASGDFDGSGTVDFSDFVLLSNHYGSAVHLPAASSTFQVTSGARARTTVDRVR